MGFKSKLIAGIVAVLPQLRPIFIGLYQRGSLKGGWHAFHPYDQANGVDTSGMIPGFLLGKGTPAYGAAQPSIIKAALEAIPDPGSRRFIDIGCGKGRPLLVAAELGFQSVTGIEFSPSLAKVAQKNVLIHAKRHPDASRIEVVCGDALDYDLPLDPLVIFLYNSMEGALVSRLIRNIEASLEASQRELYIIFYNPVHAEVVDRTAIFQRYFAKHLSYDPAEIGFGPDEADSVVIWQSANCISRPTEGNKNAAVHIVTPGWRAEVARSDTA